MKSDVYVTAERLAAELHWKRPPAVLDVRWSLTAPNGRAAYTAGHVPGAHYVDLETELSGQASLDAGRHPLPGIADLQRSARRWGLNNDDAVVCYDDFDGVAASRAWWVLKWAGMTNVRILDGGFRAWSGHGPLEAGRPVPKKRHDRGNVDLAGGHMPTIAMDEAAEFDGLLLDARTPVRYRGEFEPMDSRAGHIPGAVNAPYVENLRHGQMVGGDALRERFSALGALDGQPVATYCGSGVSATHHIAALASLGVSAALYPGSWSQWAADLDMPAAAA